MTPGSSTNSGGRAGLRVRITLLALVAAGVLLAAILTVWTARSGDLRSTRLILGRWRAANHLIELEFRDDGSMTHHYLDASYRPRSSRDFRFEIRGERIALGGTVYGLRFLDSETLELVGNVGEPERYTRYRE